MKFSLKKYCFIFLLIPTIGWSQPGMSDANFNPNDMGFRKGDGALGLISTGILRPNGKFIVGGKFYWY